MHREPAFTLSGQIFPLKCTSTDNDTRLDISASGFWGGRFEKTYFDVGVFNANAPSYVSSAITSCYRKQEQEKKRKYKERIRMVEQASFMPLVFSCTGGASKLTTTFLKNLSYMISEKSETPYSITVCWIRCRLAFALLRSAVMCLRGCRSRKQQMTPPSSMLSVSAESLLHR